MKEGERGIREDSAQVLAWGTGWKGACTGREHSWGAGFGKGRREEKLLIWDAGR